MMLSFVSVECECDVWIVASFFFVVNREWLKYSCNEKSVHIHSKHFKRWAEFSCLRALLKILVKTNLWDLNQNTRYSTYIFLPSPPYLSHPLFVHKKMQEGSTYLVWKCSIDTLFHSLLKKPELSVNSHPSLRWPEAISLKTSQGATLQIGRKHKYEFCMRGNDGWTLL